MQDIICLTNEECKMALHLIQLYDKAIDIHCSEDIKSKIKNFIKRRLTADEMWFFRQAIECDFKYKDLIVEDER